MVRNPPTKQETKIPWRREWLSTPVFLPGKSHGQRSLTGYSPWSHKELDMTEPTHVFAHTHTRYRYFSVVLVDSRGLG